MNDRLLFWLVALSPLLSLMAWLAFTRWGVLHRARLLRELTGYTLALGLLGGLIAWDVLRQPPGERLSVRIVRQEVLLALPVALGLLLLIQHYTMAGLARGRLWSAYLLRASIAALLTLALAGLQMVLERDTLSVVFALDASKSVPASERAKALNFINGVLKDKPPADKAGVLLFGGNAAWEQPPTQLLPEVDPRTFRSSVQSDQTNIDIGLRQALSRSDDEGRKRVLLFTDGRQTAGDASEAVKRAVSQGADVWIVPLQRGNDAEMLIEKLNVPSSVLWEQVFNADVFVWSNVTARAKVQLYLGDRTVANPDPVTVDLVPGKNRVAFPGLRLRSGGAKEIRAVLIPLDERDDSLKENNEAYAFSDVQTESRVLILANHPKDVENLRAAMEGEKTTVDVLLTETQDFKPELFLGYDCIILANIPADTLQQEGMRTIERVVKDQGTGLIMIGGDQAFGAGGYLGTPIEEALPVSMDLKNQRVMPSGALVIVLHTCEFADGNAWGRKISKAAIKVLTPNDYAGLIFYGNMGGEQWAFKPAKVREQMFALIDGVDAGDMPTLDPICSMAATQLANLKDASVKHMIVITDGDPAPPTPTTMALIKNNKITLSVVTIFPHHGSDISTMKQISAETGGRYYSADNPKKLPQIFTKEAAVVRKNLIRSDERGIPIVLGVPGPTLKEFGSKFPDVNAFVVTGVKDRAELQLYTTVEGEKVPILASWQYGLGKAVAFTSDASTRWNPQWVKWESFTRFWVNTITWASRQRMPSNHTIITRLEGNQARVIVEGLDSKGDYINFAKLAGTVIDPDVARGKEGQTRELAFTMTGPGRYEATFPAEKAGAYSVMVTDQTDPKRPATLVTGLANSYSPEFMHTDTDAELLAQLGQIATAGFATSRLRPLGELDPKTAGVFKHDLPPVTSPTELFWPLLLAALCLFPLDVAFRRLMLDPEKIFLAAADRFAPLFARLRGKQAQLQAAAAQAIAGAQAAPPPPPDIVPQGDRSRSAQSMYEEKGQNADFNLNPNAGGEQQKPVVGGTKVSPTDAAASAYTSALLKAKKRANKDKQ